MKTPDGPSIAIVGVTGAVGQEFLRVGDPLPTSIKHFVNSRSRRRHSVYSKDLPSIHMYTCYCFRSMRGNERSSQRDMALVCR
jgi:Semialdehyde dehydrogenase, NAD binding domain